MSMGLYDTIQDKSFVVYETIGDLEKMGDQDWADVRCFYYSVCSELCGACNFSLVNRI
jgi:hypothetical protein